MAAAVTLPVNSTPLPEIDVLFENYRGVPKAPPNNRAMAACPNGHPVVRYIKDLPNKYTNLTEPKSMYVEDLVRRVEQQVPKAARQHGAVGFHTLLQASLQVNAHSQLVTNCMMTGGYAVHTH